jgi:hypothetical protein
LGKESWQSAVGSQKGESGNPSKVFSRFIIGDSRALKILQYYDLQGPGEIEYSDLEGLSVFLAQATWSV